MKALFCLLFHWRRHECLGADGAFVWWTCRRCGRQWGEL